MGKEEVKLQVVPPEVPTSVKDFITNESNIKIALNSAMIVEKEVSKNWFTAMMVRDKLRINLTEAIAKMDALKLFGLVYERQVSGKDKEYKIIFDIHQRLILVEEDIKFYSIKTEILKREAEKLREKIKSMDVKV